MSRTPDTSVVVAGLCSWHPDHELARPLIGERPVIVGHVLVEAYSVLTRLPRNQRVRPELALSALSAAFLDDPVVLAGAEIRELIQTLGRSGVAGGAAYDAVVAETARRHGLTLITLDERATTTYEAIGVDTVFLGR